MGRVYCCHRSTEDGTALWFYVPPDVPVNVGDVVIIRNGPPANQGRLALTNVATEVREKQGAPDSRCSWDTTKQHIVEEAALLHLDAGGRLGAKERILEHLVLSLPPTHNPNRKMQLRLTALCPARGPLFRYTPATHKP